MVKHMTQRKPTVFISYNQKSGDAIADQLQKRLETIASVVRDKSSIPDWGSIKSFMKSIRDQDLVVMLITAEYLKSFGCMFEVVEAMKDDGWNRHTMFVVATDAIDIYSPQKWPNYLNYWKDEEAKFNAAIESVGDSVQSIELAEKLRKVKEIEASLFKFLAYVADAKNPDIDEAIEKIYQRVNISKAETSKQDANKRKEKITKSTKVKRLKKLKPGKYRYSHIPPRVSPTLKEKHMRPLVIAITVLLGVAILYISQAIITTHFKNVQRYEDGITAIKSGDYNKAINILSDIKEYKNSSEYIQYAEAFIEAEYLENKGLYESAIDILQDVLMEPNVEIQQRAEDHLHYLEKILELEHEYIHATKYQTEGNYAEAVAIYERLGNYKDSFEQAKKLKTIMKILHNSITISACIDSSLGVTTNGNVLFAGQSKSFEDDIRKWTDIVSIAGYGQLVLGLKLDGTVVHAGKLESYHIDTKSWNNIVAIAVGDTYIAGLTAEGTVVAQGHDGYGQMDIDNWTNIIAISTTNCATVGLTGTGEVLVSGYESASLLREIANESENWTDIVAISAGGGTFHNSIAKGHIVGLKRDGTVVAVGDNRNSQCEVDGWTNIIAVAAGEFHTVGLTADGRVLTTQTAHSTVSTWTNIVAISAGYGTTLAVDSTGKAYGDGFSYQGQINLDSWNNIAVRDEWKSVLL